MLISYGAIGIYAQKDPYSDDDLSDNSIYDISIGAISGLNLDLLSLSRTAHSPLAPEFMTNRVDDDLISCDSSTLASLSSSSSAPSSSSQSQDRSSSKNNVKIVIDGVLPEGVSIEDLRAFIPWNSAMLANNLNNRLVVAHIGPVPGYVAPVSTHQASSSGPSSADALPASVTQVPSMASTSGPSSSGPSGVDERNRAIHAFFQEQQWLHSFESRFACSEGLAASERFEIVKEIAKFVSNVTDLSTRNESVRILIAILHSLSSDEELSRGVVLGALQLCLSKAINADLRDAIELALNLEQEATVSEENEHSLYNNDDLKDDGEDDRSSWVSSSILPNGGDSSPTLTQQALIQLSGAVNHTAFEGSSESNDYRSDDDNDALLALALWESMQPQ